MANKKTADEMFLECGYRSSHKEKNSAVYYSALHSICVDKDGAFKEKIGGSGIEVLWSNEILACAKWIEEWRANNELD